MQTAPLVEALYAIGIGLVVGLEREHSEVSQGMADGDVPEKVQGQQPPAPPRHTAMGARTCALLGLAGWLLAFLGDREPWLLPIGLVAIVGLIAAQMWIGREVGMTTEIAGVVVVMLGALVHRDKALAAALCLGTTLLLVVKPWMIRFVHQLRRIEILATLQLLLLAAIILPLLPSEPQDPWGALPPRKVAMFVVLIEGVQYVGYVLTRLLGSTRGTGIAGLVGGLTSSTAVTVSMARSAREAPELVRPGQLATFLANTVMPVRVAIIAGAVSPAVGWRIAGPMAGMTLVLLGAALVTWRQLRQEAPSAPAEITLRNPFQPWGALAWGAVLCVVLLVAKLATQWFGDEGLLIAAGVSGLTDVDAITLAAAEQQRSAVRSTDIAALAIAIAVCSNTIVKGGMAWFGGSRAFGRPIVLVFLLAIAVTVATAVAGFVISG
ncbi:MAG: DUF4010 domain-containing protein [Deltaproteobacteria bacterium]|nr:DUF4010 domain-containing protein [Kofleriaceae bacterium]